MGKIVRDAAVGRKERITSIVCTSGEKCASDACMSVDLEAEIAELMDIAKVSEGVLSVSTLL